MPSRILTPADLTKCPDCRQPAFGGSHGENCLLAPITARVTAGQLIRRYATTHEYFGANELRPTFERHGIKETARGPAMGKAVKDGVLRKVGHVRSNDEATKGHEVASYQSLIYRTT